MKILQVSPFFYPAVTATGTANIARAQSKRLVRRGHDVSVYTSNTRDASFGFSAGVGDVDGIKVYYCASLSHRLAADYKLFFCPGMLSLARRHIAEFDIVHLNDYRTLDNLVIGHFAKRAKVPYVLQAHGAAQRLFQKRRLKTLFDMLFGQKLLRNAAGLLALSRMEREEYIELGATEHRITLMPNGVEPPEEVLPGAGELFRERFAIGPQERVILFLGRIHRIKGLDVMLRALATLVKRLDGVKFVVAGHDDRYMSELRRIAHSLHLEQQVVLTGRLSDQEKWPAISASDVLVLPSLYEAFPVVVLESWAMGVPVVVTPHNGLADWVRRGAGIVAPRDQGLWADALFRLLTRPLESKALGRKGKELVRHYFAWDRIVDSLEQVYCDALEER